jgi:hypothetical protein
MSSEVDGGEAKMRRLLKAAVMARWHRIAARVLPHALRGNSQPCRKPQLKPRHYNFITSPEVPQIIGKFLADPLTNIPAGAVAASQAAPTPEQT